VVVVVAGDERRPDGGRNGCLDVQSYTATFATGSIPSIHGVAIDADDAVSMLLGTTIDDVFVMLITRGS